MCQAIRVVVMPVVVISSCLPFSVVFILEYLYTRYLSLSRVCAQTDANTVIRNGLNKIWTQEICAVLIIMMYNLIQI